MKALARLLASLCLLTGVTLAAEQAEAPGFAELRQALARLDLDPDAAADTYLSIYQMLGKGDTAVTAGDVAQAKLCYEAAQGGLQRLKQRVPEWNRALVDYRLKKVEEKLGALAGKAQVAPVPADKVAAALQAFNQGADEIQARQWAERMLK